MQTALPVLHTRRTNPILLCPFHTQEGTQSGSDMPGLYYHPARGAQRCEPQESGDLCWRTQSTRTQWLQLWPQRKTCALVVFGLTHKTSPRARHGMHRICQNRAPCLLPVGTGQTCLSCRITAKWGGTGERRQ